MKKIFVTVAIMAIMSASTFAASKSVEGKQYTCDWAACYAFGWFCC